LEILATLGVLAILVTLWYLQVSYRADHSERIDKNLNQIMSVDPKIQELESWLFVISPAWHLFKTEMFVFQLQENNHFYSEKLQICYWFWGQIVNMPFQDHSTVTKFWDMILNRDRQLADCGFCRCIAID